MQNATQLSVLNEKYPQLKSVSNKNFSALKKVKEIEAEKSESNYVLLKRFLLELQLHNNSLLSTYNREVI